MADKTEILFSLFQKLDYRDKENSGKKKITAIIIAYLFSNTILSFNYYHFFDKQSFIILSLTSNLFLLSIIVLSDFTNLFFAGKKLELLKALPLIEGKIFLAKFFSAALYLSIFIIAASLPQIIFFYLLDQSFPGTLLFFVSSLLFCYSIICVMSLIYVFSVKFFNSGSTIVINILQLFFLVFVFYSTSLSSRAGEHQLQFHIRKSIMQQDFVSYLPQTLFSKPVSDPLFLAICFAITAMFFFILYMLISKNYYSLLDKINLLQRSKNYLRPGAGFSFINKINNLFLSNNYERAAFQLTGFQLKHSRFLRTKYFPLLIMPLLLILIGMFSGLQNLLFYKNTFPVDSIIDTGIIIISPSISFTILMCSRLLISNTKILDSGSLDTLWIFESLPVMSSKSIIRGANKFIYLNFIIPVLLVTIILLSIRAPFFDVAVNILFLASGIYLINSAMLYFDKTYPFTLESSRFSSASKFLEIFLSLVLAVILFLIQIFVFQNIIFVLITIILFVAASVFLNRK